MKKVLWVSDGYVPTGFSRVAHNLIDRVPDDIEVHHLAINYYGDPHNFKHRMYPAYPGGDFYGIGRLPKLVKKIKPDVIFLFNDINVISKYLTALLQNNIEGIPVYVYYPVDSKYLDPEYFSLFPKYVDHIFTYTEFALRETKKVYDIGKIEILPHGVDTHFHKLDNVSELKKQIAGGDYFVILNANRNQPRKRIDITMKAFSIFAKDKDDVRLYLHMGVKDSGWDLVKLAKRYGIEDKLILTSMSPGIQTVPDEVLNQIFNIADVGVNTSEGEGFGLTAIEMGKLGVPQIVPNNSASGELFGDIGVTVDPVLEIAAPVTNTEFSLVHPNDVAEAMNKLYSDKHFYDKVAKDTENKFNSDYFDWDRIANQFWSRF